MRAGSLCARRCLLIVSASLSLSVGGSECLCVCRSVCVSLGRRLAVCVSLSFGGEGLVTHDSS